MKISALPYGVSSMTGTSACVAIKHPVEMCIMRRCSRSSRGTPIRFIAAASAFPDPKAHSQPRIPIPLTTYGGCAGSCRGFNSSPATAQPHASAMRAALRRVAARACTSRGDPRPLRAGRRGGVCHGPLGLPGAGRARPGAPATLDRADGADVGEGLTAQIIVSAYDAGKASDSGSMLVMAMRASGLSLAELLGGPVPADRCRAGGQIKRRVA